MNTKVLSFPEKLERSPIILAANKIARAVVEITFWLVVIAFLTGHLAVVGTKHGQTVVMADEGTTGMSEICVVAKPDTKK